MDERKRIKLIIDTNWWISYLVSKKSVGLPDILLNEEILICFSNELSNEIYETLKYARNKKRINEFNLKQIINFLELVPTYYAVTSNITICRDPKDNFLLALAKDASADFLLTGDKDLLEIAKFENTIICTLGDFLKNHFPKQ